MSGPRGPKWGLAPGDDRDPNYGRSCMLCGTPVRRGERLVHECSEAERTAHLRERAARVAHEAMEAW